MILREECAPVAHSEEHRPSKPKVAGSNPAGRALENLRKLRPFLRIQKAKENVLNCRGFRLRKNKRPIERLCAYSRVTENIKSKGGIKRKTIWWA